MTKQIDSTVDLERPTGVVEALSRSWRHADTIRLSADSVASTFQWLHANSLKPILLLDYDVICGALPSLALDKGIRQIKAPDDILSISRLAGPSMLRLLLQRVEECIIPPGTAAELLVGMERSHLGLSERARNFVARIHQALTLDDPAEILTNPRYQGSRDLLLEDLTHFNDDIQDHQVLQTLLSRAVDVDSLLSESPKHSYTYVDAFRSQYDFLTGRRPGRSTANFHDALNAALVVRLFNSTISSNRQSRIPVLISNTRAIHELNRVSESYLRQVGLLQERPFLFNDSLFLIIAQGLLERTQNRYGVAGGSATQIARDTAGLVSGCLDLLMACHGAKDVTIADLPSSDLDMLYWRREKFERDWGSIFAPSIVAAQRDRSDYLRMLLSRDFRRVLQSDRVEDLAHAIGERIVTLKSEKVESFALWELFLQHRSSEQLTAISARAFDYYVCDNDGTLLRELHPTVRVNEALPISLSEDHDFRLVLAPAYLSSGVVLSVASFLRSSVSPRRYVSFTWLHRTDPLTISRELLTVLLAVPDMSSTVAMAVFTDLHRDDVVVSLDGASKELTDRCSPNVEGIDTREFFQLRRGRATVYADLQLLEGSELQASLTVDVESLTSHVYSRLLHAMTETIEVPITMQYLRRVLDPVCRFLQIDQTPEGGSGFESSPTRADRTELKERA